MLKSGGDLKRFPLCPFVAGVPLWSDSLENKEGVNLITKSRQANRKGECSSLGKQLPVPNNQETTQGCRAWLWGWTGAIPTISRPSQVYEARGRSENRADANFFPESQADLDPNTNGLSEPARGFPTVCAVVRSIL